MQNAHNFELELTYDWHIIKKEWHVLSSMTHCWYYDINIWIDKCPNFEFDDMGYIYFHRMCIYFSFIDLICVYVLSFYTISGNMHVCLSVKLESCKINYFGSIGFCLFHNFDSLRRPTSRVWQLPQNIFIGDSFFFSIKYVEHKTRASIH